ncbi:MAG TPA: hypothetical protein VGR53_09110 [Nitrososphaerales archaeon]|nr:hypothetical protein [Nitrososphaerales archaeon]
MQVAERGRMRPIITVYSRGLPDQTKKFEGFITAAFWIGLYHTEGEMESVKVRQPNESYDNDVANLGEFTSLMVQRQINFSVEFFSEPTLTTHQQITAQQGSGNPLAEEISEQIEDEDEVDFESQLTRIKDAYRSGLVNKKQYETKKGAILKKWKDKVEGKLET